MKGIEQNYSQHIGSMNRYKYSNLFPLLLTEGTRHVASDEQCYWLMDVIGSHLPSLDNGGLFIATLEHAPDPENDKPDQFRFRLQDDIPANKIYAEQMIEFSDFPKEGIRLYVSPVENNQYLAYLPSEY